MCWEDLLGKEMATQPSILAWRIPWTEEPGKLQPMGLQSQIQFSDLTAEVAAGLSLSQSHTFPSPGISVYPKSPDLLLLLG